jgi:similar to spore coat protein
VKVLAEEKRIAPHEMFELHELITFKTVCATKSSAMVGFIGDEELKALVQKDFSTSQAQIRELRDLIQLSVNQGPVNAAEIH